MVFLSPIGTFWRIVKHRSTEDFESLPYVCTLLNSSLWTYYGLIKPGELLVATVNGFGIVVEAIYVALFLIFAPPKMKAKTAILVTILDVGFLAVAIVVTRLALRGDVRTDAVGFLGAGLNIVMYASPLVAMFVILYVLFMGRLLSSGTQLKTVVTTKSVEYMPFFLSFFLFLNGGIWSFYAFLVHDYFLGVPNGMGFILGTAQLVLYATYRKAKALRPSDGLVEEGGPSEHLISSTETMADKHTYVR